MNNPFRHNPHFWGLVFGAGLLAGLGVAVIGYGYATRWAQTLWHVCQNGLQDLGGHAPVSWQLAVLVLLLWVLLRGLWSFSRQVWQTHRFGQGFSALQSEPPARLRHLLRRHGLTAADVVYLDLTAVHVFCLGFWRPRVWLTGGLLNALTDDELQAVLAHEAYHLRRRDPLRLAIGRAIRTAFFFLPLMASLARQAELNQELEADQAAIACSGDDLPLLCALQKLLARQPAAHFSRPATITAFNVTEARLRRLLYRTERPTLNRRLTWSQALLNLGVLIILTSFGYLSVQPVMEHAPRDTCTVEHVVQPLQSRLPLDEWPLSPE